ncbi:MAG TPA: hypothetical protein V6C81_32105 [Planktothrix sp.]|jgi:hypothetical protein
MTTSLYNASQPIPAATEISRLRPVAVSGTEVQEFIERLRAGDLNQFAKYIRSFEFNAQQLADIVNIAAKRINRPEVWLPHAGLIADTHHGKPIYRIRLQFRVDSVQRILSVCTDPTENPFVSGPPRDCPGRFPVRLHESPSTLFRHLTKLYFLPRIPLPPPLTVA